MSTQGIVITEMRRTYAAQRGVSQGAHITLTSVSGGYQARFACATRCALVLGDRNLQQDPPSLLVPTDELHRALTKLSDAFSVALVDTTNDETGTRFVLVWKIMPRGLASPEQGVSEPQVDANQGSFNLDEY